MTCPATFLISFFMFRMAFLQDGVTEVVTFPPLECSQTACLLQRNSAKWLFFISFLNSLGISIIALDRLKVIPQSSSSIISNHARWVTLSALAAIVCPLGESNPKKTLMINQGSIVFSDQRLITQSNMTLI